MSFLHWRVDQDSVARLLPEGLQIDLVDGSAWVGLTPFQVERFRLGPAPPLPFLSSFPETNLRTYVRDGQGRDGLWFLSLDVASTINALTGRIGAVPYFRSRMSITGDSPIRYRARRLVGPEAHHDIVVKPGEPLPPDQVEQHVDALTGRWRAFTRSGKELLAVPVQHQPWELWTAEVVRLDESVTTAAGLPPLGDDVMAHYSEGVDARLGRPRPCRRADSAA